MLRTLRAAAKTKVAGIVIGALVLAFALWGVSDIFQGSATNAVVATVGGTDIPTLEYDRELRAQMRAVAQQTNTEVTPEQVRALGIDQAVLDNIISRTALDEEVDRFGLTASDEAVAAKIRSTNAFFGAEGAFNIGIFQQALQQYGISEAAFVETTRKDMARAQLISSLTEGIAPPPGLTRLIFDLVNETRVAEYVVLMPGDAGAIAEPSEADLAAYHKAHPDAFSAPEYRQIEYVMIAPEQLAADIPITDEEAQKEYDAQKDKYQKPEQREVEQISFSTKDDADAASAKLKSGTDFTALARERGLKDADLKLGSMAASALPPALAQAVFAVPEGGVTAPVQGPFGWVILRAARITPGETKNFAELKDAIKTTLARARAAGKMSDLANSFEDARAGGAPLADAAKEVKMTVHRVAAVDNKGLAPDGSKADIPAQMGFLERVFATESGEESDIFQSEDMNYYAVKIVGVTPAALKPLETVRTAVRDAWMAEARGEALKKRAEAVANDARKDGFAKASQALGKTTLRSVPMRRDQPSELFGPALTQQIFTLPQGGVVAGLQPDGQNYVVARVAEVNHPTPDFTAPPYAQVRGVIAQQLSGDLAQTLAAAARTQLGVTTHPEAIQSVLGEELQ